MLRYTLLRISVTTKIEESYSRRLKRSTAPNAPHCTYRYTNELLYTGSQAVSVNELLQAAFDLRPQAHSVMYVFAIMRTHIACRHEHRTAP